MILDNGPQLQAMESVIETGNYIVGQQGTSDIIIMQQNSTRSHCDQSKDEFLHSISKRNMNLRSEDMIGILCDYIASIDDAVVLE
jgi:hypothetical protein